MDWCEQNGVQYVFGLAKNLTGNASVTDIGPLRICWCVELYD
jgi:hypothetical protein